MTVPDHTGSTLTSEYVGKKLISYGNQYDGSTNKTEPVDYYVPKVRFHIDWSYSVQEFSNKSLFELVSAVEFAIGDEDRSVKSSGIGVASFEGKDDFFYPNGKICEFPFHPQLFMMQDQTYGYNSPGNTIGFNQNQGPYIPNYPIVGRYADDSLSPQLKTKTFKANERRDFISFYSADNIIDYGDESISDTAEADQLIVFGSMKNHKVIGGSDNGTYQGKALTQQQSQRLGEFTWGDITAGGTLPVEILNSGRELGTYGYYSELHPEGSEYSSVDYINIEESAFVDDSPLGDNDNDAEFQSGETFIRMDSYYNVLQDINAGMRAEYKDFVKRLDQTVFKLQTEAPVYPETNKFKQFRGIYYTQAFKDESFNFKEKEDTRYIKAGQTVFFESSLLPNTIDVNGGDTITSIFFFKNRDSLFLSTETTDLSSEDTPIMQVGSMIGFVSQARKNIRVLKEIASYDEENNNDFNFDGAQGIAGTMDLIERSSRLFYQTYGRAIPFGLIEDEVRNILQWSLPQNREYIADPNGSAFTVRPKYNRFYESIFGQYDYKYPIGNLSFLASNISNQ